MIHTARVSRGTPWVDIWQALPKIDACESTRRLHIYTPILNTLNVDAKGNVNLCCSGHYMAHFWRMGHRGGIDSTVYYLYKLKV